MKTFEYVITDEIGIHARPAGLLAKATKNIESKVTLHANGKSVDATKLMAIMGMGIKCGDTVEIQVEGTDEENAIKEMKVFFESNL